MAYSEPKPIPAEQDNDTDVESADLDENENTQIRHKFIRKVYMIILLQLLFTSGIIALFTTLEEMRSFARNNYWLSYVSYIIGYILILIMSPKLHWVQKTWIANLLTAASTILFSLSIGAISGISSLISPNYVLIAALITDGFGIVITILAFQTWTKIPDKGKLMMSVLEITLLFIVIVISTANFFIKDEETSTKLGLASYFLLVIVFTSLLFSDTQLLTEGDFTTSVISPKESIYKEIFIFKFILKHSSTNLVVEN